MLKNIAFIIICLALPSVTFAGDLIGEWELRAEFCHPIADLDFIRSGRLPTNTELFEGTEHKVIFSSDYSYQIEVKEKNEDCRTIVNGRYTFLRNDTITFSGRYSRSDNGEQCDFHFDDVTTVRLPHNPQGYEFVFMDSFMFLINSPFQVFCRHGEKRVYYLERELPAMVSSGEFDAS